MLSMPYNIIVGLRVNTAMLGHCGRLQKCTCDDKEEDACLPEKNRAARQNLQYSLKTG